MLSFQRPFGSMIFAMALLAALSAGPAFAGETVPQAAAPAAAAAPAQPGCGEDLDLAAALAVQGEVCPATEPESLAPDFMALPAAGGRTCRCSCGFPCKTDADCGPGGRCTAGITCC